MERTIKFDDIKTALKFTELRGKEEMDFIEAKKVGNKVLLKFIEKKQSVIDKINKK